MEDINMEEQPRFIIAKPTDNDNGRRRFIIWDTIDEREIGAYRFDDEAEHYLDICNTIWSNKKKK